MSTAPDMYERDERVELVHTTDPHTRLTPGIQGTVRGYSDRPTPTLHVAWDNGSTLSMLLTEGDVVTRVQPRDRGGRCPGLPTANTRRRNLLRPPADPPEPRPRGRFPSSRHLNM